MLGLTVGAGYKTDPQSVWPYSSQLIRELRLMLDWPETRDSQSVCQHFLLTNTSTTDYCCSSCCWAQLSYRKLRLNQWENSISADMDQWEWLTSEWLIDRCGGGGCAGSLGGGSFPVDWPNIDLTLCTGWEVTMGAGVPWLTWSAVSRVVGRSISRWIWMPSPGPMWVMWLKLEGALIILERRSGFLKRVEVEIHHHQGAGRTFMFGLFCIEQFSV